MRDASGERWWGTLIRVALALAVGATVACQDTVKPGTSELSLSRITATYVCGNNFTLQNEDSVDLTVRYSVLGTPEVGELVLPRSSSDTASSTPLITLLEGPLQISTDEGQSDPVANESRPCPPDASPDSRATLGEWSAQVPWPIVAVHLHLLPSGQVLSWGRVGVPQVYEPGSGSFRDVPSTTMVFCSGHTFVSDGRLLVAGGHLNDRRGLADANIFDADLPAWQAIPRMRYARWYPTTTTLADGQVLVLAGTDQAEKDVEIPEVWNGSSWRSLSGARRVLPYYPRTFVAPNGLVFYAGELQQTGYLDPSGTGRWIPVADSKYGRRDYGSAVMYAPGKVMILGGSDPPDGTPTRTAELIDLSQSSPSWRYTEPMRYARRHLNATIVPDGQILVTGGTSSPGFSNPAGAVHVAEMWDPATERWSQLAANRTNRVYHSSTLLLPDGRILHAGSGDGPDLPRELNAELFSPPYLFKGPRPTIEGLPAEIVYGQPFVVRTPDAGQVVRVTLVRLASVTHGFDQSQRFVELGFRRTAGGLEVAAPESGAVAPPGPYLLSILNGSGVPSVARIIRVS